MKLSTKIPLCTSWLVLMCTLEDEPLLLLVILELGDWYNEEILGQDGILVTGLPHSHMENVGMLLNVLRETALIQVHVMMDVVI